MVEDFRQFLKVYHMYKKGKAEMEKAKKFIDDHSKEILMSLGIVAAYQLGFKRGFKSGIKFEDALLRIASASKGGK